MLAKHSSNTVYNIVKNICIQYTDSTCIGCCLRYNIAVRNLTVCIYSTCSHSILRSSTRVTCTMYRKVCDINNYCTPLGPGHTTGKCSCSGLKIIFWTHLTAWSISFFIQLYIIILCVLVHAHTSCNECVFLIDSIGFYFSLCLNRLRVSF